MAAGSPKIQTSGIPETKAQKDRRMKWFREARFGMFIHWGLYSIPAGYWKGKTVPGAAEWLQYTAQVPPAEYEPLREQFNPVKFDARKWVRIAKAAGMKYIVITSKHHEGFGMWPSKQGDWNIGHTAFKRDPLKELADACKKEGLRLCFYHSIMDWHHPDYLPRKPWDRRDASTANMDRYVAYMKAQLKELLTNYGPIGILWFDGEWENTWNHERGQDLYNYVRSLQPNIIVNNRVDVGRGGMGGMSDAQFAGDYGTPEQEIPANGLPGVDWESCMTMNDTWGFSAHDQNWKSATTLIQNLVDCASKGGNYLLNVGPTSLGEIPQPSIDRLRDVGTWLSKNGEAIYSSHAGPFPRPLPWGRVTQKPGKLYLAVFDPQAKELELPGLQAEIRRVSPLGSREALKFERTADGFVVHLPETRPSTVPVYVVDVVGTPVVTTQPVLQAKDGSLRLPAEQAEVTGSAHYESDKKAIGFWTHAGDVVNWNVRLRRPGTFQATVELACESASAGSTFEVSIGGRTLVGTVPDTGSWFKFVKVPLGTVELPAGDHAVQVKATNMPHGAVMNLRSVTFLPRS